MQYLRFEIFLHNPNKIIIEKNSPVFAGTSFVGQTKKTYMNFIEVILLSDNEHVLPIKSDFFYCDARGKGKPMLISCKLNHQNHDLKNKIGDIVFTSGLGGIYPENIKIGNLVSINKIDSSKTSLKIKLIADPLNENLFGVIKI